MMHHNRFACVLALLLALLLAVLPAAAERGGADDAMDEEDGVNVFTVEAGTYEWYQLPSDYEDDHAYLDIWPNAETVIMKDGAWQYTFTMQEVGGCDFYPYTVVLVGFSEGEEVSRNAFTAADFTNWWTGEIPADSTVTYTGTEHNAALTALAISVIGLDASGYELEFHSIVYLSK